MSDYSKHVKAVRLNDGQEVPDVIGTDPDPSTPEGYHYVGYGPNGKRIVFTAADIAEVLDTEFVLHTTWVDECMAKQH